MNKILLTTLLLTGSVFVAPMAVAGPLDAAGGFLGVPPNAQPGECYGRVTAPAVKETVSEQVLVKAAGKEIANIIPAKYDTVNETIVVKEEEERLVTIPATYKTVTETIVVTPETTRIIPVAAQYTTETERVLVKAARTVWKKGDAPNQNTLSSRVDSTTGDVMCLVEEPAVYKTISKRVLASPETTRQEAIPAVTKTITKRIIDEPARVESRIIPAVTKTITKRVLVEPESVVYAETPAQYRTVNKEVLVSAEKVSWNAILCNTNADTNTIAGIQSALREAGYNPGRVDGVLGAQTYKAVDRFQRDNNLMRGQITLETVEKLGLTS